MKIEKIKINAFGGLTDRNIELSDNINLIYGKNEAGKSTLLKFITNIFYGTSKNKKGRFASDYDLFKPWNVEDFSGKISYQLDNGEKYEVYREFGKKNAKIYNNNLEEISKQFSVDKNTGNQFFYDQAKVDEDTFMSTFVSMQQEVKLDTQSQNVLIQKIANIAGTGDDNISYKKAIDKINKKQIEEIGSVRTHGRPINIVTQNLSKLKYEKEELGTYKNLKYEFEDNKNKLENEIIKLELELDYLKAIKSAIESQKIEQEKVEYNNKALIKNDEKIDEINIKIKELEEILKSKNNKKQYEIKEEKIKNPIILSGVAILFFVIAIIMLFTKFYVGTVVTGMIGVILLSIYIIKSRKNKLISQKNREIQKIKYEKNSNEIMELNTKINSKIAERKILEDNNEELEKNIEQSNNKMQQEIIEQKNNAREKLLKEMNNNNLKIEEKNILLEKIENTANLLYSEINNKLEQILHLINEKRLELHRMDLNNSNIIPKLDNLARVEEELETAQEEYQELVKRNERIELAKTLLEKAYEKMKKNVTPKFTENLSHNLEKFSNSKYKRVTINDEKGLLVELPNGEYISAERLSVGTIDQLYLALRLLMVDELSNEKLPIILDEAFAYYDDERLKNVLRFIAENYSNRQVIILTCTGREEKSFMELGIKYKKIEL